MRAIIAALLVILAGPAVAQSRTLVTTPTVWYVDNVAGNDANLCTVTLPCATLQHTLYYVANNFDFAVEGVIQLVTTGVNYPGNVQLVSPVGSAPSPTGHTALIRIRGDVTNNAAVVVGTSTLLEKAFTCVGTRGVILDSIRVIAMGGGGVGILADGGCHMLIQNMNFGQCGFAQIQVNHMSFLETLAGPYTISGSAQYHVAVGVASEFINQSNAVTFVGTPSILGAFQTTSLHGIAYMANITSFSGARSIASCCSGDNTGGAIAPTIGWP